MAAFSTLSISQTPAQLGSSLAASSAPVFIVDANVPYRLYFVAAAAPAPSLNDPHLKRRVVNGQAQTFEVVPEDTLYLGDLYVATESAEAGVVTYLTGETP